MYTLPCLTLLMSVLVPCCITKSVKQHIDTNRSDLRGYTGGGDSSNDNLNTGRQMTNSNIPGKTRSGSDTDIQTNGNILSKSEINGQRQRTNSNMGRDNNRSDNVNERNGTNYSVQSGVNHGTNPNASTNKKKDEGPNETIHQKSKGVESRPLGVPKGVHQPTSEEEPPSHTSSGLWYTFLVFLGVMPVLFCMVCLGVRWTTRSDSDSQSLAAGV